MPVVPLAPSSDIAFTPAVKAAQASRGSRAAYARMEARGGFRTGVTPELVAFLALVDTAFLGTASAAGQPYVQHRGGPKGFIRKVDATTVGFIDFAGNRQYVSTGNLSENPRAFLFLMDYATRRRMKLWGTAALVDAADPRAAGLQPDGYDAEPEQALLFTISAWDVNCPQHIPQKVDAQEVAATIRGLQEKLERCELDNGALRRQLADRQPGREGSAA